MNERMDRNRLEEEKKLPITSKKEAEVAWDLFNNRFLSEAIPELVTVTFDPSVGEFKPRKDKEKKTDHSDAFEDFLNGCTIVVPKEYQIQLNKKGLMTLKKAIERGDWHDEIFQDKINIYYALWLFKLNQISRQQMSTIFTRQLAEMRVKQKGNIEICPILKKNGKFTSKAKEILLPLIVENSFLPNFTANELNRLRYLLSTAPKSEQVFFMTAIPDKYIKNDLKHILIEAGTWYQYENYDIQFSFGFLDSLQIAERGINAACPNIGMLGKITPEQVEEKVIYNSRPGSIDTLELLKINILHEHNLDPEVPMIEIKEHDNYHTMVHSSIPYSFNIMLNHIPQIIRKHCGIHRSKNIWDSIDRDLRFFKNTVIDANTFFDAFLLITLSEKRNPQYICDHVRHFTDEGVAIFWNMLNYSDVWKKLYRQDVEHIESYLNKNFNGIFEKLNDLIKYCEKHEDPRIINLKYRLYSVMDENEFIQINAIIEKIKPELLKNENFKFTKKGTFSNQKNIIVLELDKNLIVTENNINNIVEKLVYFHTEFIHEQDLKKFNY